MSQSATYFFSGASRSGTGSRWGKREVSSPFLPTPQKHKSSNNSGANVFSLRELSSTFPSCWLSLHVSRCCSVGVFKPRKHPLEGRKKNTLPWHPLCFRNVGSLPLQVCYCCEVAVAPPSSSLSHNLRVKGCTLSLASWFGCTKKCVSSEIFPRKHVHSVGARPARPLWKGFVPAVRARWW